MTADVLSVKTKRKLKAPEEVAGLLSDLSPEEFEAFLEAKKQRLLFEKSPYAELPSRYKRRHRDFCVSLEVISERMWASYEAHAVCGISVGPRPSERVRAHCA